MRTVTKDEIRASLQRIEVEMGPSEIDDFIIRMQEEQPYIQVYVAAICDGGGFDNEDDADILASLATIVWHAMRTAAGSALAEVTGDDIDAMEEKTDALIRYVADEAEAEWSDTLQLWLQDHNQRPLIEFVLDALMNPDSPYTATENGVGIIFPSLKVIIDCLDNAECR